MTNILECHHINCEYLSSLTFVAFVLAAFAKVTKSHLYVEFTYYTMSCPIVLPPTHNYRADGENDSE